MELIMRIPGSGFAMLLVALASSPAFAATAPLETILIPVVASHARDATGAFWSSRVAFLYTGAASLEVFNEAGFQQRISPGERGELVFGPEDSIRVPGRLVQLPLTEASHLFAQSHVYDESAPQSGVIIPAIRQHDLTDSGSVHLIAIPVSAAARTLLRIFDLTVNTAADVSVRVYGPSGELIAADTVHLVAPPLGPLQSFPAYPLYGEYRPNVDVSRMTSISIDIEPVTPHLLLWAFTTTTDSRNESVVAVFPAR
jgi:hypothetical protein